VSDSEIDQFIAACAVLQTEQLVHGGIKPSNIFVRNGRVQLVDGGLPARTDAVLEQKALTFIAPEVLSGSSFSSESDLYSVGATLYRFFSKRDVFEDRNADLLREKCINARPRPLTEFVEVEPELSDVIMGLIGRDQGGRKQAFSDLLRLRHIRSVPATQAALMDREACLNQAIETQNRADSDTQITAIEGAAGTGKTRLIEELSFHNEFHSRKLLVGHAYERENRRFEPLLQAIEQWFNEDRLAQIWLETTGRGFSPSLAKLLPDLDGLGPGQGYCEPTNEQLTVDLVGILIALGTAGSACSLALDDLHWADDGTLQVLKQLGLRAGESGLHIIVTFKQRHLRRAVHDVLNDLKRGRAGFNQVSLAPLDEAQTIRMARTLSRGQKTRDWIVENSGGNPLLVEECARYREAGTKHPPSRIQDVLVETVKRLPGEVRTAAEVLSLFPKPVPLELAIDTLVLISDDSSPQIVADLSAAGVSVERDGHIEFRHDGIRKSIYRNIPPRKRKKLHKAIYLMLAEVNPDSESAAFHAKNGGLLDLAISAYESAGTRRRAEGDYQLAAGLYSEARNLYDRQGLPRPVELDVSYAQSLAQTGQTRQAQKSLKHSLDRVTPNSNLKTTIYLTLGTCSWERSEEAVQYFELATASAHMGSPDEPRALLALAHAYALSGRTSEAESTLVSCHI
jgi:tetratricopeptide (TPR) repeat protein